ncbi:hypothetical protein CSA56_16610 [candidate division KSB3 bacterium]|uniref:DUF3352 domain-containing protein n=1 Tax=candidate division KSB3 bacterium TaxID=2044937 RepID=A0A2G6K8W1_9BACT|nr:MAG: hypothetical protein CSA56_16610 [candidate division KSB3 bacterium]
MKQTKRLLTVVICVMLAGMSGMVAAVQAQAPEDNVFAVIKISNPEALLPEIAGLVDKFQPGFGGMVNSMMVGSQVFKNPEWKGMDMAGGYTAVVLNPMMYMPNPVGIIVPLTNKDEYIEALSETLTGGEETDGVYNFIQPNQKSLMVGIAGNAAILTESPEVVAQVKALVESNSAALSDVPVVKGQIAASIDLEKIFTAMQPMIDMFKQQALAGMAQDEQMPGGVEEMLEAEINILLDMFQQTKQVQLGIGIEPEGVRLAKAVFPVEDSDLSAFMAAQMPKSSNVMGMIPGDSAVLMSGSINFTPEFKEGYMGFLKAAVGAGEVFDEATSEKIEVWVEKAFDAFGSDLAVGMLSPTSDSIVTEVLSLKDAAKAKELMAEYPEIFEMMTGQMMDEAVEKIGLDIKMSLAESVETKGGEILSYDFNLGADVIPDPNGQEAFKQLLGEKLSLPIGFTDQYAIVGFGKGGQAQVASIMEVLDSGAKTAAAVSPAAFGLPEENNLFMFLSVPKILAWAKAKNVPGLPPFEVKEGPGVAMAGRFVESHFEGELYLPVEELLILKGISGQAKGAAAPPAQ